MSSPILTATIEDLPPEMISKMFNHLHLKDLAACLLVNKRWYSIYASFKLHSLVVIDKDGDDFCEWCDSNQTVEEKYLCHPSMFLRLAEKPLLSNLRQLALYTYRLEFDFNELNRFQQLVHLEINANDIDGELHLNLPRLKVLAFRYWNEYCALSIDCPLLSTLAYPGEDENANLLKVKHPGTIRKLKTDMVAAKLVPFNGVECLITREFEVISKAILLSLPKLRELRYIQDIRRLICFHLNGEIGTVDRVKRTLSEFVDEVKKLKGSDFRFRFAGLQLTNVNVGCIDFGVQIEDIEGKETVFNEYVYMKYYHLIEPGALDFVRVVNYSHLLSNVIGEFPRCFSQKFTDIQQVNTSAKVPDANHFLWFLKSLRSLRSLFLVNTELSQAFYDQLPASTHSLVCLGFGEGHCEDGLQVNFDFIRKLLCLSDLEVKPYISLESFTSLVRWLGRMEDGNFKVQWRQEKFWIEKKKFKGNIKKWVIEKHGELLFESENPEEMLNFFQSFTRELYRV